MSLRSNGEDYFGNHWKLLAMLGLFTKKQKCTKKHE